MNDTLSVIISCDCCSWLYVYDGDTEALGGYERPGQCSNPSCLVPESSGAALCQSLGI